MRYVRVVPMNKVVNEGERCEFLFEQAKQSFDLSVGLGTFHTGNDVIDVVRVEEILERKTGRSLSQTKTNWVS